MTMRPMIWALYDAPVEDPTSLVVLLALCERANDDGTCAWPSQQWIAKRARISSRTVRRVLSDFEASGLIRRGDQRFVDHIPSHSRPVVWDIDLMRRREVAEVVEGRAESRETPGHSVRPDTGDRPPVSGPPGQRRQHPRTPVADNDSLDSSLDTGGARSAETPPTAPAGEPPRRCSRHEGTNHDGACGACGDARRNYDSWARAAKPKASTYVPQQKCLDHPGEPAGRCNRCASEAVRPKRSLREMYQAAR